MRMLFTSSSSIGASRRQRQPQLAARQVVAEAQHVEDEGHVKPKNAGAPSGSASSITSSTEQ